MKMINHAIYETKKNGNQKPITTSYPETIVWCAGDLATMDFRRKKKGTQQAQNILKAINLPEATRSKL